jgi:hypothetical protein
MKTLARAADKSEIVRRLRTLQPDSQRLWGRMTAHQMVCHLSDSYRMVTGQKPVSDATGTLQRTVIKWIALYSGLRWRPGISTRPEIDQTISGTPPGDFCDDVEELEALVDAFTARTPGFEWPPHPIFGPMSESAWLRWGYLHMDHHLRQFGR